MGMKTEIPLRDLSKWFRSMSADERALQASARSVSAREYHHGAADAMERAADKLDAALAMSRPRRNTEGLRGHANARKRAAD